MIRQSNYSQLKSKRKLSPQNPWETERISLSYLQFKKLLVEILTEQNRQEKQKEMQSYSPWNRKHKHRKWDKMKWQRNKSHKKDQDKTPENNN